jgi:hypothetical protein
MAPHITKIRPPTEPYEFHRARQKVQQKDMKEYLKGRVVWRSCIRMHNGKNFKLEGTYVMPICPLCLKKEKRCICLKNL